MNKKYFWKDIFFPNVKSANAVKDISFKINKGESVAFLGPNGAGKKTTIKMLTELLDVEKHLDTQVRKLSLGERMKLELIRSMIHMPQILFLEEPTIGLDVIAKQTIREFLRKVQREFNVTILLTSHDMDDIEHVCDRVVVINHGEKIYDDTLEKLNSKYNEFKFVKCNFDSKELSSLKYSNASNKNINFLNHEIIEKGENYFLFKVKKSYQISFLRFKRKSKLQILIFSQHRLKKLSRIYLGIEENHR